MTDVKTSTARVLRVRPTAAAAAAVKRRLHLGCAKKRLEGWINIDIDSSAVVDVVCDVSRLTDFATGSVDEIYACHILEHFGRARLVPVLCEWNRVLKVGGKLRIAVPDFESCVRLYLSAPDQLFDLAGLLHGGQKNQYDYHHVALDLRNLAGILERCGFANVARYQPESFLPAGFDDFSLAYLPHNDRQGTLMSLNVVATKTQHRVPVLDPFLRKLFGRKLVPQALESGVVSAPPVIRVSKATATGFGDRLGICLLYAGYAHAIGGQIHVPWDSLERAWGPTCLHGGWPSDIKTIQKYISFSPVVLLSDEKTVAALPETAGAPVREFKQQSILVGSILPTPGWSLIHQYPDHPPFDAGQFAKAYRQACRETVVTHPIQETLPPRYAVVHVRGGDKHNGTPAFLQSTQATLQRLKQRIPARLWRVVSDDAKLCQQIPALADVPPLPATEPGLLATLRDFAVLTGASLIVQHSPNGWSAFSHMAACLREIPIINTCPGPDHGDFLLPFFRAKTQPSYFYRHDQVDQCMAAVQHLF